MHHAIVVGVEHHQNLGLSQSVYAETDAQAFADALTGAGFRCDVLLGARATKTAIDAAVRRTAKALAANDTAVFFYRGHGFSHASVNHVSCHDTQPDDAASTSVSVDAVLEALRASPARSIAMFLDADRGGRFADAEVSAFSDRALAALVGDTKSAACFVACAEGESSYGSNPVEHGVWAYHLVRALGGHAPLAIDQGLLTSSSLQKHLATEVAKTVRAVREKLELQTPWACGALGRDFVVADLSEVLRGRLAAKQEAAKEMTQAVLKGERTAPIQRLAGFTKKIHRIPEVANAKAHSFVAQIAQPDVRAHLDKVYADLRSHLGYKRRDLTDAEDSGLGTIQTPDFHYAVSIRVDEADPSMAVWSYEVSRVTSEQVVASEGFESALGTYLDSIEYEFTTAFDVEAFIDRIEDQEPDGVDVDYERGSSQCEVRIDGFTGVLVFTAKSFRVTGIERPTPRSLVQGLMAAHRLLVDKHNLLTP